MGHVLFGLSLFNITIPINTFLHLDQKLNPSQVKIILSISQQALFHDLLYYINNICNPIEIKTYMTYIFLQELYI